MKKKRTPVEPPPPNVEWYTVEELAARWRVSPPTVLRYIASGVPAMKIGRQYRIHISTIEAKENEAKPAPKPSGRVDMSEFETEVDYTG